MSNDNKKRKQKNNPSLRNKKMPKRGMNVAYARRPIRIIRIFRKSLCKIHASGGLCRGCANFAFGLIESVMKLSSLALVDLRVLAIAFPPCYSMLKNAFVCVLRHFFFFFSLRFFLSFCQVDNVPSLAEMISREGHLFKIVVEGESFAKLRENGTLKSSYVLRFDSSCLVLFAGAKKQIDVCALKEVRLGFLTQPFLSFAEKHRVDENAAFSLLYEVEGSPLPKVQIRSFLSF